MNSRKQKHLSSKATRAYLRYFLLLVLIYSTHATYAQWLRTDNGISGANVSSLAGSGANLFAGTSGGGIFISADGGTSWSAANTGLNALNVMALTVSGSSLLAGTLGGAGVYVSTNNGSTWSASNSGLASGAARCFAINGSHVFAGTILDGVFRSSDNGASWVAVNTGLSNLFVNALTVVGSTIFAGTTNGIFLSSDNGADWTEASTGLTAFGRSVRAFVVNGSTVFAGTSGGVFSSGDNGSTWSQVNTGLTNTSVLSLTIKGTDIFAGTHGGLFLSSDNGASWAAVNTGLTNLTVQSLHVSGSTVLAGTSAGLFTSVNNGANWLHTTGLKHIALTSQVVSGTNHFVGTREGVYLSTNNGESWTAVNTGLSTRNILALTKNGTAIFAGTNGGGVFISTNNGTSWANVATGGGLGVTLSLTTSGSNIVAGTTSGAFISTNNGASWTSSSGLPAAAVNCFLTVGTTLFAGTGETVYKSTDNGATWTQSDTGITSSYVRAMGAIGTTIFASTNSNLFISTDNGANWTVSALTGIPNGRYITDFAVHGTILFASTNSAGIFTSKNNGDNWSQFNIPNFPGIGSYAYVYDLEVSNNRLFAGLENFGLWSRALAELSLTITSFTPTAGPPGTMVTITGTGFLGSISPFANVNFNGATATIASSTSTTIITTVPASATTGPINVSNGVVSAASASNFIVAFPPTITNFSPTTGLIGAEVIIRGTNFSTTPGNNTVMFNGTSATVTAATATSLTVTVPPGATTGTISVTVNSLTATSSSAFTVLTPDTSAPTVVNNTSSTITDGSNLVISATCNDAESGITSVNLLYRWISAGGNFTTAPMASQDAQTYTYTIETSTMDELGVEYKINVTNGAGLENADVLYNARVSFPENGLIVPYNSPGSEVSNYRIVAIPLVMTASQVSAVFDELGAADNSRWRMFRYQNGTNAALNASSTIEPGNGYWLITKDNPGTLRSGVGVTVNASTSSPFSINLSVGWNQIGNPYNFNISWADVQAANPGLPGLRKYDGTFVDATQLNKMEGGFVNVPAARSIIIPTQKNVAINGGRVTDDNSLFNPITEKNWQVYLELKQGKQVNKISGFGMHQDAAEGYDIYDGLSMPRFFASWLEINHQRKDDGNAYAKDMVPSSEYHTWEFTIESSLDEDPMILNWDNTYFGDDGPELYLWDDALQLGVNMRTTNRYQFRKSESKLFRVVYGTSEYVKAETAIQKFALHEPWPNPATRADGVTLSLAVPESKSTNLLNVRVVDVMGRTVWSHTASYPAGRHTLHWKPTEKEVAGVYVVLIKAGQSIEQKRVIVRE